MKPVVIFIGILLLAACQKSIRKKDEISKIEIATSGCLRGCPVVGIQIDSSLKLVYHGGYKSKLQGYYEGKITQDVWDTLNFKLKHINYRKIDTSENLGLDGESAEAIFYWNKHKRHIYRSIYENPDSISDALIWIINCYKRAGLQKSKDSVRFETTYQNMRPPIMIEDTVKFPPLKRKKSQIINDLSDKHWDVYRMKHISYDMYKYGYHFKSDGVCSYYFYNWITPKVLNRLKFSDFHHVTYPETWTVKNESTITILGTDYKILKVRKDTLIILNSVNNQDTLYLKKARADLKLNSDI